MNAKATIELLPMQLGDVKQTFADIEKSIKMLNYKPITNVNTGIKKFISWYKEYNKLEVESE